MSATGPRSTTTRCSASSRMPTPRPSPGPFASRRSGRTPTRTRRCRGCRALQRHHGRVRGARRPDDRRQYDEVRAEQDLLTAAARRRRPSWRRATRRKPWSRRRAWTVLVVGVLVALLGFGAALLTWSMHEHDAQPACPLRAGHRDANRRPACGWSRFLTRERPTRDPCPSRNSTATRAARARRSRSATTRRTPST